MTANDVGHITRHLDNEIIIKDNEIIIKDNTFPYMTLDTRRRKTQQFLIYSFSGKLLAYIWANHCMTCWRAIYRNFVAKWP